MSEPAYPTNVSPPYLHPNAVAWAEALVTSYRHWVGQDLVTPSNGQPLVEALFHAPCVVVSHGTQADPIFNYANQIALTLWEMDWPTFTQLPSRLSAESMHRDERDRMLAQLEAKGYVDNYQGIRISSQGHRFRIEQAIIWNIIDAAEIRIGQAATFTTWTPLKDSTH